MSRIDERSINDHGRSIADRILRASDRLDAHERDVAGRCRSIAATLRRSSSSPTMLWIAGAAGFLIGESMNPPLVGSDPAEPRNRIRPQAHVATWLSHATRLMRLFVHLRRILEPPLRDPTHFAGRVRGRRSQDSHCN